MISELLSLAMISSINVGVRYSSLLETRGVVQYRDYQIDPVVGVFAFDDRLEFLGDSLSYRDFVYQDKIRLRTQVASLTDQPLFPVVDSIKNGSPQRGDTYEWRNRAEFFLPGYNDNYLAEFDLGLAKDLSRHWGHYVDLQSKIKIFRFHMPGLDTDIEPNLFASIGWGDAAHNRYFYGPGAGQDGLNNSSLGLWFAFPEESDRFYPIVQLIHFQTLGHKNRNADFAKNRDEGWLFSFIATFGAYETKRE